MNLRHFTALGIALFLAAATAQCLARTQSGKSPILPPAARASPAPNWNARIARCQRDYIRDKTRNKRAAANDLYRMGQAYFALGKYDRSAGAYKSAQALYQQAGDPAGVANALLGLGDSSAHSDNPDQAIAYYTQAAPLFHKAGQASGEGQSLADIGTSYFNERQYEKAAIFDHRATLVFGQAGLKSLAGEAAMNNGICCYFLNEHNESVSLYQQSIALFKEAGDARGESDARNCLQMGQTLNQHAN